jgi:hypothetical protein
MPKELPKPCISFARRRAYALGKASPPQWVCINPVVLGVQLVRLFGFCHRIADYRGHKTPLRLPCLRRRNGARSTGPNQAFQSLLKTYSAGCQLDQRP